MSLDRHITAFVVFVVWFIMSPGSATTVAGQDRLEAVSPFSQHPSAPEVVNDVFTNPMGQARR